MPQSEPISADERRQLKQLIDSPWMKEQEAKRRQELEQERRVQAKALAAVRERRNGREAKSLAKAIDDASAAEREARAALTAAQSRVRDAHAAIATHTNACDLETAKLEGALRETADPRIAEFLEWTLVQRHDALRKRSSVSVSEDSITGKAKLISHDPPGARQARQRRADALLAAYDAADALRLRADIDVAAELAQLRVAIPAIDAAAVTETPASAASDDDGAAVRRLSRAGVFDREAALAASEAGVA